MPESPNDFGSSTRPMIEPLEQRRLFSANLVANFPAHLPSTLPPAALNHITLELTNTGNSRATGKPNITLYASTDPTLDSSDTLLTTATPNLKLNPHAKQRVPLTFPSPTNLPDGNYYLLAQIDTSTIPEANPTTIIASPSPLTVHAPFTDLSLSFSKLPARPVEIDGPSSGKSTATVRLQNLGNTPAHGTITLNFYLSPDATLDTTDPLLATLSSHPINLRPGTTKPFTFNIAIPPATPVGGYFLFAVLTPNSGIVDKNPNNNTAISSQRLAVVDKLPQPPPPPITQYNDVPIVVVNDIPDCFCTSADDSPTPTTTSAPDDSTQPAPPDNTPTPDPATQPTPPDPDSTPDDTPTDSWNDPDDSAAGDSF